MRLTFHTSLIRKSSFRVPAKANRFLELQSLSDLTMLPQYLNHGQPVTILGEGTNTLFLDEVSGTMIKPHLKGIKLLKEKDDFVEVEVAAGENWDKFVQFCLLNGWYGLENLSYIPGSVGAAPVQNIGAYGVEVREYTIACKGYNMETLQVETLDNNQCQFDYRQSVFKGLLKNRFIITSVIFRLPKLFAPNIEYPGIEAQIHAMGIHTIDAPALRRAVIAVRQSKLPDPEVLPNAGSFFKNPIISESEYSRLRAQFSEVPAYLVDDGVKVPAAWLIEQCGFKGYSLAGCRVHKNQPLVIVNEAQAKGRDIKMLADKVRQGIYQQLGIELDHEVNIVGYQHAE